MNIIKKIKKNKAFTLVEFLAVIVMTIILAVIVVSKIAPEIMKEKLAVFQVRPEVSKQEIAAQPQLYRIQAGDHTAFVPLRILGLGGIGNLEVGDLAVLGPTPADRLTVNTAFYRALIALENEALVAGTLGTLIATEDIVAARAIIGDGIVLPGEDIRIPVGSAQGDILIRDGTRWTRLPAGTAGQFLRTGGTGANPVWADVVATFLALTDTPLAYTGAEGRLVAVNHTGTGLEFVTPLVGEIVTLTGTQTLTNKTLTTPIITSLYQDAGKTNLITFPAASGTVAVSAIAPMTLSALGDIGVQRADLVGTVNQVTVTGGTGVLLGTANATLTLPQDIHPGATPTFTGLVATATGNALTLSGAGANIAFTGAGLAQITTAAGQHLALMPGGNVGIGTTTPTQALDIVGNIALTGTIDGIDISAKALDWDTAFRGHLKWDGGATGLAAATGRASLGLGRLATLSAVDSATITDGSIVNADLAVGLFPHITGVGVLDTLTVSGTTTLATTTGNVGIGTTTPTERLHVIGNILGSGNLVIQGTGPHTFAGTLDPFNVAGFTLVGDIVGGTPAPNITGIGAFAGATGTFATSITTPLVTSSTLALESIGGILTLRTTANLGVIDDIVFSPAGAERMRILENGNLFFERGTHDLILAITTPTAARTITFPDAAGTVAVSATAPITLTTAGAIGLTTVGIPLGGTGQTTALAAFNALSPLTTLGDVLFRDATNNVRLAGNITTVRQFLTQTGTGTASAAPAWGAIAETDVPGLPASRIISGVFDNARINWAAPGAIGTITPTTGAFTTLTMTGFRLGTTATAGHVLTADATGVGTWAAAPGVTWPLLATIDGTTVAPAFSWLADTDMGIRRGGIDDLRFVTAGADRLTINAVGNVGIGTATPGARLDVVGNIQNIAHLDVPPTRVGAVTLAAGETSGLSIAVSGRYAYVVTNTSPARVVVVDISNPVSPSRVGAVTLATGENNGFSIAVSGRYAYVVTWTVPARVVVVDISNPVSPLRVGAVTLATGENEGNSIAVSGRYAYVTTQTIPARVVVVDISNPASPLRVGAVTLATGENVGRSIAVSGRYAYVSTAVHPTRVVVVDISNPASPLRVGAVTLATGENDGISIAVSGRYAYVATNTSPVRVVVVDISNPASPLRVGAVTLAAGEDWGRSIAVSGRYAYIVTMTTPTRVVVVDISNPAAPSRVGAVTLATGENDGFSIAVSGRYAYVVMATWPARVVVVDIRGIETTSLMAHSLEAGILQVRGSGRIDDDLYVRGGLGVGIGGIFSAGPLTVTGHSTGPGLSSLDVRNAAGTNLLFVRDDGNVGIGTTAPWARLQVVGNIGLSSGNFIGAGDSAGVLTFGAGAGATFQGGYITSYGGTHARSGDLGIHAGSQSGVSPEVLTVDHTGNVGIGTTAPGTRLEIVGGDGLRVLNTAGSERIMLTGTGAGGRTWQIGAWGGVPAGFFNIGDSTAIAARLTITDIGNVGIGTTSPTHPLHMGSGAHVTAAGVWTNVSDIALKKDIVGINYGLADIMNLQPRSYRMRSDGTKQIGFIAQEMELIIPELISGQEGEKGISYGNFAAVLTKAIQEQQKQIEELKLVINQNGNILVNGEETGLPSATNNSLVRRFIDYLKEALLQLTGRIQVAGEWVFNKIEATFVRTEVLEVEEGITMRDRVTGEYHCVVIENGEMVNIPGRCGEVKPQVLNTNLQTNFNDQNSIEIGSQQDLNTTLTVPIVKPTELLVPEDQSSIGSTDLIDPAVPAVPAVPVPEPKPEPEPKLEPEPEPEPTATTTEPIVEPEIPTTTQY